MKAVAYYRVSTVAQGRSGLGLDAQRQAVSTLAADKRLQVIEEFTEIESGKRNDRPRLAEALHFARLTGSVLVIAKLDRLSRNAAFLLALRDSGVRFMAADIPDANDLTIGVMAVIAQAEREAISKRTTEALDSIKRSLQTTGAHTSIRSGRVIRRLGNPNGVAAILRANHGNLPAVEANKSRADQRANDLAPVIESMMPASLSFLAAALNERGILTPRGGRWHPSSVRNLLQRYRQAAS
ncbi:MAG: recombinase family protein [Fimbriimonadaceae bacterium]|nr:recombinase family protein [Fimbriimonadaceae bacterium]